MGHMTRYLKLFAAIGVYSYFVGCSPVEFSKREDPSCGNGGLVCAKSVPVCPKKCDGPNCVLACEVERRVGDALVDILFVNDNSGSMSFEQAKMAAKFPTFLQSLGNMNYRIGMVTTDISSSYSSTPLSVQNGPKAANGYGALQDGKLVQFSGGIPFLTPQTPSKEILFSNTIRRQETISCEQSGFASASCPSNDERGIFAANLVLEQTGGAFLRPMAHLAVVILSDEDERGISDSRAVSPLNPANDQGLINLYPLESRDRVDTFISNAKNLYPDKTVAVHSMIVRPKEYAQNAAQVAESASCLTQQTGQGGNSWTRGIPGYSYAELSSRTGGTIGSICDADFGPALSNIASTIQDQVQSLPFSCDPIARVDGTKFSLFVNGTLRNDLGTPDYAHSVLNINSNLPALAVVKMLYDCRAE
jgi:hypothetical protein